jgi:hypothetical protein
MKWVKTYEAYIYENKPTSPDVEKLEKVLGLPAGSGIMQSVKYDDSKKELIIEQPRDLNPMDAGAVLASINKEKSKIKSTYRGIKQVIIGDLQITI